MKLYQFGVCQRRNIGLYPICHRAILVAVEPGAAFAFRPQESSFALKLVRKIHETWLTFKHDEAPLLFQPRP